MSRCARPVAAAVVLSLGAAGCAGDMGDLHAYIDEVRGRPGGEIEPLPEVRPAPEYRYAADALRSPFVPDGPARAASEVRPQQDRPREYLEQYPLDTMRMVGTLELRGTFYALVRTQDGRVHRVTHGNHLGQNEGRIEAIHGDEIHLREIVPDGLGGYVERTAAMSMSN